MLEANARKIVASRGDGDVLEITGEGLKPAQSGLSDKAPPNIKIRRGAVIRVAKTPKNTWEITQLPQVEGAFVALDPRNGAIHALVGGFDFDKNKFNHVTQAFGASQAPASNRSSIPRHSKKALPLPRWSTMRCFLTREQQVVKLGEPKNYDGKYDGPMTLRTGLAKSKNMISDPRTTGRGYKKCTGLGSSVWL